MNQYTVDGGLVASATGIDMNDTALSEVSQLDFNDPTTDGINTTADGVVAADDLMAKDIQNTMTTAGGIAFPAVLGPNPVQDAFRSLRILVRQLVGDVDVVPVMDMVILDIRDEVECSLQVRLGQGFSERAQGIVVIIL